MKPNLIKLGLRAVAALALAGHPAMADDGLPGAGVLQPAPVSSDDADRTTPTLDEQLQPVLLVGATYAGFETKITTIAGGSGLLVGGQAGWTLDPHVMLGFAGYGLASTMDAAELRATPSALHLAYGGVRAAYVILPRVRFHVTLSTLAGLASVSTTTRDMSGAVDEGGGAVVLALEPEVEAEMNLASMVRLALSGSYRYVAPSGLAALDGVAVSGLAGGIALKIGAF